MRTVRGRSSDGAVATGMAVALMLSCGSGPAPTASKGRLPRQPRAAAPFVPPPAPPCLERCRYLRVLARGGAYDLLEMEFDELERSMLADCRHEGKLMDAIDCFETSDVSLAPSLDAWVEARPASWAARLARAAFHGRLASLSRTTHWARDVSEEQWAGYHRHSELATADLREVLRLRPATLPAYTLLLGTERHHADADLLARALQAAPFSYHARSRYLWYLQPKWGGSMEEMERFVADAAAQAAWYPDLLWLEDTPTQTRAEGPWRAGDYATAERIFSDALQKRESTYLRVQRASLRMGTKRLAEGLADLDAVLERKPCHRSALEKRAWLMAYTKRQAEARAAYDVLLELDPLSPDMRFGAAIQHFHDGDHEAAARDLLVVTQYDPINRSAWNNLGFSLLELGRIAEAEQALTHAIDLDDKFVHTRYKRGKARYLLGMEAAYEDLQAFVDRKQEAKDTPQEGGDVPARLAWAEKVLAGPRDGSFPFRNEAPR